MKRAVAAAAIAVALGVGLAPAAWAQSSTPATGSMTQQQALGLLEAAGLRNIRNLTAMSDGTWRAQVTSRQGENVVARIDSEGKITLNTGVAGTTVAPLQAPTGTPMAEDRARMLLEAAGLQNIRNLTQLNDGTWRAQVTSAQGNNVQARIDTEGNIMLNTGVAGTTVAPTRAPTGTPMAEDQARRMLEAAGLQNIRNLSQSSDGTWRAQVTSAQGNNVQARIDAEGNITLNTGIPVRRQ